MKAEQHDFFSRQVDLYRRQHPEKALSFTVSADMMHDLIIAGLRHFKVFDRAEVKDYDDVSIVLPFVNADAKYKIILTPFNVDELPTSEQVIEDTLANAASRKPDAS